MRTYLLGADRVVLDAALTARQREALDYGYRERVTDTHLP